MVGVNAGAAGALERCGCLNQLGLEADRCDQGECVEDFGEDGDVSLSGLVLAMVEVVGRPVDGDGESSPGRGFAPLRLCWRGGRETFGDLGVGEVGG